MYDLEPSEFFLGQNYPNPFSEKTTIKYCIAYKTKVRLEIYDTDGERIKTLLDEEKESGTYEIEFKPLTSLAMDNWATGSCAVERIYSSS